MVVSLRKVPGAAAAQAPGRDGRLFGHSVAGVLPAGGVRERAPMTDSGLILFIQSLHWHSPSGVGLLQSSFRSGLIFPRWQTGRPGRCLKHCTTTALARPLIYQLKRLWMEKRCSPERHPAYQALTYDKCPALDGTFVRCRPPLFVYRIRVENNTEATCPKFWQIFCEGACT